MNEENLDGIITILNKNKIHLNLSDELTESEKEDRIINSFFYYLEKELGFDIEYATNYKIKYIDESLSIFILTYHYDYDNGYGDFSTSFCTYLIDYKENKIIKKVEE